MYLPARPAPSLSKECKFRTKTAPCLLLQVQIIMKLRARTTRLLKILKWEFRTKWERLNTWSTITARSWIATTNATTLLLSQNTLITTRLKRGVSHSTIHTWMVNTNKVKAVTSSALSSHLTNSSRLSKSSASLRLNWKKITSTREKKCLGKGLISLPLRRIHLLRYRQPIINQMLTVFSRTWRGVSRCTQVPLLSHTLKTKEATNLQNISSRLKENTSLFKQIQKLNLMIPRNNLLILPNPARITTAQQLIHPTSRTRQKSRAILKLTQNLELRMRWLGLFKSKTNMKWRSKNLRASTLSVSTCRHRTRELLRTRNLSW
jgi:hypothetical protein